MNYNPEIESEQMFIGCMIKDNDLIGEWESVIQPEDFMYHSHNLLWKAIIHLYTRNIPADQMHITDLLRAGKKEEEFGELSYIRSIRDGVVSTFQHTHFGGMVKKNSAYRKVQKHAESLMQMVEEREQETESEVYQAVDAKLISLQAAEKTQLVSVKDNRDNYRKHITSKPQKVLTGLPAYDRWAKGIGRQWLYVLSGRPGVGKTAKAAQMAYDMSRQDEGAVLFWSMEMPQEYILDRLVSNLTGINYRRITDKELEEHEVKIVMDCYDKIADNPLYFDDSASVAFGSVRAAATKYKRKYGKISAIFVDYLTHMDIKTEKGDNFAKAVGDVCKRFKSMARELDCAVILLAQISRGGEEGEPKMSHLKDSGGIEQTADLIEILWKDEDADTGKDYVIVTSTIVKGRLTGTKTFKYAFRDYIQRMDDHIEGPKVEPYNPDNDGLITWSKGKGRKRA